MSYNDSTGVGRKSQVAPTIMIPNVIGGNKLSPEGAPIKQIAVSPTASKLA